MNSSQYGGIWIALSLCPAVANELPAIVFTNLSSLKFSERETAQLELLRWGRERPEVAMTELLKRSRHADDPEVRARCHNVLRDLVTDEYLKDGEGYIGIGLKDDVSEVPGEPKPRNVIRVVQVQGATPAERAGIRQNDLIVAVGAEVWAEPIFREKIRLMKPNTKVDLKILREGKLISVNVSLGRRPINADGPFFKGLNMNPDATERAAKEAYFRLWLSQRKTP